MEKGEVSKKVADKTTKDSAKKQVKRNVRSSARVSSAKPETNVKKVQGYKLEKKKVSIGDYFKNIRNKISKSKNKLLPVIIVMVAIVIIALVIIAVSAILYVLRMKKFEKYEQKMDMYAISSVYQNQSAKTTEKVTKLDAIKLAIASMLNTDDISGFAEEYSDYEGQRWVKYAEFFNIADYEEVTEENKDETVKYEDLVRYFENAKKTFTKAEVLGDNIVLKNAAEYDTKIQVAFSDLVSSKIIEVENSNIDGKQEVFKGLANELAINSLEKLFTVSSEKQRLRVTEMPKLADAYPYILFDVPQKIYDYEFSKVSDKFITPKELYKEIKSKYSYIRENIENYFENLYTVDYETLNPELYTMYLENYSGKVPQYNLIRDYINYIIKNKIKTESSIKLIEPCIYFDGESLRSRIEVNVKLLSGDTKENILFGDSIYGDVKYAKDEYTFYLDVKFIISDELKKIYIETPYSTISESLNKTDLDINLVKGEN